MGQFDTEPRHLIKLRGAGIYVYIEFVEEKIVTTLQPLELYDNSYFYSYLRIVDRLQSGALSRVPSSTTLICN